MGRYHINDNGMEIFDLTPEKREKLYRLWFVYGNNGPKHTHHNHRYIQNILESGENTEDFYRNADRSRSDAAGIDWNTVRLTDECLAAVKTTLFLS